MTTAISKPATASVKPYQSPLFPVDETEELLFSRCHRYKTLDEECKTIVRTYLLLVGTRPGQVQRKEWADKSGLSRSTFYRIFGDPNRMPEIHAAITEAAQLQGHDASLKGSLALPFAGDAIMDSLQKGRDTRTLTSVELTIMLKCMEMRGMLIGKGPSSSASVTLRGADGSSIELKTTVDADGIIDGALSKLSGTQAGT